MKHVDEYRDPRMARRLIERIHDSATRRWTLMEVCGGQTHSLLKHGLEDELRDVVELIHGPGCPVCVTPLESLDFAQRLARRADVLVCSFGDMLRVPGSRTSLLDTKAEGGQVRAVYSPLDAVDVARRNPEQEVVFFAVGFETTTPATALAVRQAERLGLNNFSLLVSHVRVLPAMDTLMQAPGNRVQGFLAAGHVCTIEGLREYESFVAKHRVPVVAAGFEPVDLLDGILACVEQLEAGAARVENRYGRSVRTDGNAEAQQLVNEVYEVCTRPWRGLGDILDGGLRLQPRYARFDAATKFAEEDPLPILEPEDCRSGDVLAGRLKPTECAAFGKACTPTSPLGAPMVSSEGACAAYYRFRGEVRA